jgi:hypothetical protein
VFDFFFDLFRKEKPLYRWRERPSLNAFLARVDKDQRPKNYWNNVLKTVGVYLLFMLGLLVFRGVLGYVSHPDRPFLRIEDAAISSFVSILFLAVIQIFQNVQDRIVELYKDRLVVQGAGTEIPYSYVEYFRITQMRHASSSARYPCLALCANEDGSEHVETFGPPNPKVAARVQEILSRFVPFRMSEPSDDIEFNFN